MRFLQIFLLFAAIAAAAWVFLYWSILRLTRWVRQLRTARNTDELRRAEQAGRHNPARSTRIRHAP